MIDNNPRTAMAAMMALVLSVTLAAGCSGDAEDLPEWTPADHNNNEKAPAAVASAAASGSAAVVGSNPANPADAAADSDLGRVFAVWKGKCVRCHGPRGRGDGPDSPMVQAPDLSRSSFQDGASDEEIASLIRSGRGKMPAFDEQPPEVVDGLVQLIRKMRAER